MDPTELREANQATWAAGDWTQVAKLIESAAEDVVEAVEVGPKMKVLDVGAGNGNVSILAAERGAKVTASDITSEWFDAGRRRAKKAGVEIEWVEADAEELPFEDASFDCVTSVFGVMFAPRHQRAADELARVLRPGGVVGLANWTPEGTGGQLFKIAGAYAPSAPDYASPPTLWGNEKHVRKLFARAGLDLEFERNVVVLQADSTEHYLDLMSENYGPWVSAQKRLTAQEWNEMRAEYFDLFSTANKLGDEGFAVPQEYLRIIGRSAS